MAANTVVAYRPNLVIATENAAKVATRISIFGVYAQSCLEVVPVLRVRAPVTLLE